MEVDYNIFGVLELRVFAKVRDSWAILIGLLRFYDARTRTSTEEGAQKQFDSEELDNEVNPSSDDPTITEEGAQKQFDPEESDNEE